VNAYTRNLITLWALVLAVYLAIFLFTSPIRMARFTPTEQHSLFEQISGLVCEYGVLEGKEREIEAHTSLSAITEPNHLASTDIRYLYWLALQQNWQTPECFTYVMSRATCDEHLAELGTASYTLELLYKHTRRQAQLFAKQGAAAGHDVHPCAASR